MQRLNDKTPPETVATARAKHDAALQLLQRNGFTRYLTALQSGDDDTSLRYAKEISSTVAERAKLVGAYAPQRAEVDVTVTADPTAIIADAERQLLALVAERQQSLPATPILDVEVVD